MKKMIEGLNPNNLGRLNRKELASYKK